MPIDSRDMAMLHEVLEKNLSATHDLATLLREQIAASEESRQALQTQNDLLRENNALQAAVVKLLIASQADSVDTATAAAVGEAKNTLINFGYGSHYLHNFFK